MNREVYFRIIFSVMLDEFGKNVRSNGGTYGERQRFANLVLFFSHEFCDFL
ncbi:Uncharacterised protein [Segatella copri]|nr:Uncharacterised protein [Segatella copri]